MERFMDDDMLVEHGKDTTQMWVKYEDCVQELSLTKADAQATIAALQARVNGLEKDSELLRQSRDDFRVKYESVKNDAITLQAQLTQRTAELEAIEKILDIDSGKTTVEKVRDLHHSFKQVWEGYQDAINEMFKAQAELERVRGALADERTAYKALSEQYNRLDTEQHRQGMEGVNE